MAAAGTVRSGIYDRLRCAANAGQSQSNRAQCRPAHECADLLAELRTMPRAASTIIVGDLGKPITAASLSRMVRLKLRDLGVTGYSIHGLRKNAGNEIAEAGGT